MLHTNSATMHDVTRLREYFESPYYEDGSLMQKIAMRKALSGFLFMCTNIWMWLFIQPSTVFAFAAAVCLIRCRDNTKYLNNPEEHISAMEYAEYISPADMYSIIRSYDAYLVSLRVKIILAISALAVLTHDFATGVSQTFFIALACQAVIMCCTFNECRGMYLNNLRSDILYWFEMLLTFVAMPYTLNLMLVEAFTRLFAK